MFEVEFLFDGNHGKSPQLRGQSITQTTSKHAYIIPLRAASSQRGDRARKNGMDCFRENGPRAAHWLASVRNRNRLRTPHKTAWEKGTVPNFSPRTAQKLGQSPAVL